MKKIWRERSKIEKILVISRLIVSLAIICAFVLEFMDIWSGGLNLALPLYAVHYLLEMIYKWNKDKDEAALSLFMAIIILAVSCAVFFL